MSLRIPSKTITINGTDYTTQTKEFWCTDEDLAFGMGKFSITVADTDGTVAAAFPAWTNEVGLWKNVSIAINGVTVFAGKVENVAFETGKEGDTVVFTGYNQAAELANQFITKDYSQEVGLDHKEFLNDVFTNAHKTFPSISSFNLTGGYIFYTSSDTSPGYIRQRYVLDILRDVLSATGYAARVDTSNVLQYFDPTNTAYQLPTGTVISVYPSDSNNFKEGRTVRDIQEAKNYLEFTGSPSGFAPAPNWLTRQADFWTTPTFTRTLSDIPPTDPIIQYQSLIYTVPLPSAGAAIPATFNFDMIDNYPIKNDVDQLNGYCNLIFNKKTGIHLWTKTLCPGPSGLFSGSSNILTSSSTYNITFTDTNGNIARSTPDIEIPNEAWDEKTLPVPLLNWTPYAPGQTNPYAYVGNFNFSAISSMSITFFPGSVTLPGGGVTPSRLEKIGLNNMYFVCQPFYVPYGNPNLSNSNLTNIASATPYGMRDQAINVGATFINQIDLQAFGDDVYPSYVNPMLRGALTVLVDPNQTYYKAGYSIQQNVPRWGYSTAWWRILQVRWEFSKSKGFITKLDVTPQTNQ